MWRTGRQATPNPHKPSSVYAVSGAELLNHGHGQPVDQGAMLMIGAQLSADKTAREISTAELIERIRELSAQTNLAIARVG